MLPAPHRLSRGADLRRVSRRGIRCGAETLVVHLLRDPDGVTDLPARVGFVVSRAVGNSVVRHRVQRRLRHLCRERLDRLPGGGALVVRALGPASAATYQELGADLDRCLQRVLDPADDARHRAGPGTVS